MQTIESFNVFSPPVPVYELLLFTVNDLSSSHHAGHSWNSFYFFTRKQQRTGLVKNVKMWRTSHVWCLILCTWQSGGYEQPCLSSPWLTLQVCVIVSVNFSPLLCSALRLRLAKSFLSRWVLDFLADPQRKPAQGLCLFNNRTQPRVMGYRGAAFAKRDSYRHYDLMQRRSYSMFTRTCPPTTPLLSLTAKKDTSSPGNDRK